MRGSSAYRFEGHAIVSIDDMIADRTGRKPDELDHPEDWARFQAALDRARLVVLGRRSHEVSPNPRGRSRLVLSGTVEGLDQRADGCWWNPDGATLQEALAAAAPGGGAVAIPGGRRVFDYFLGVGFDSFHLARNERVELAGGVPVFSACGDGRTAEAVLEGAGLFRKRREVLDRVAGVSLTEWRRP